MASNLRRTWAEIDLDTLARNYRTLKAHIGDDVKFLGVVKADAYGHGSVQVSRCLEEAGADYLAVSSIDEAMELRVGGITMPILILGHTPRDQVQKLIEMVRSNQINCIMVKDFSRFGRNSIETGYFIERVFPLFHTRFISVSDDFDSDRHKGDTGGMDVAFKYTEVVKCGIRDKMHSITTQTCWRHEAHRDIASPFRRNPWY